MQRVGPGLERMSKPSFAKKSPLPNLHNAIADYITIWGLAALCEVNPRRFSSCRASLSSSPLSWSRNRNNALTLAPDDELSLNSTDICPSISASSYGSWNALAHP